MDGQTGLITKIRAVLKRYRYRRIRGDRVPHPIVLILLLTLLLCPYAILPNIIWDSTLMETLPVTAVLSITWIYFPYDTAGQLHILDPQYLPLSCLLGGINILYAVQLYRYCKNRTTALGVNTVGLLTLVGPIVESWNMLVNYGLVFGYVGPIPIQFIVGIILVKLLSTESLEEPWYPEEPQS